MFCKSSNDIYSPINYEKIEGKVIDIDSTKDSYIIKIEYKAERKGVFLSSKRS